jgi:hypothetical protein
MKCRYYKKNSSYSSKYKYYKQQLPSVLYHVHGEVKELDQVGRGQICRTKGYRAVMPSAVHLLFLSGIKMSITATALTKVPIRYHLILCNVSTDDQFTNMPWTNGIPPVCLPRDNTFYLDIDPTLGKVIGHVSKVQPAQASSGVTSSSTANYMFLFFFFYLILVDILVDYFKINSFIGSDAKEATKAMDKFVVYLVW